VKRPGDLFWGLLVILTALAGVWLLARAVL
jgi:hypothetical protein